MSLDKVIDNQECPDAQSQISISLADMEQFMQNRQQTARPLHYMSEHENSLTNSNARPVHDERSALPGLPQDQLHGRTSIVDDGGRSSSLPKAQERPELQSILNAGRAERVLPDVSKYLNADRPGCIPQASDKLTLPKLELLESEKQAEVTKKAVDLLTKGNLSELKQLFDKIRKDGDDASEGALLKAIEKQTGIKVIYDRKSLTLDCLINPGQRDNEKRLGVTIDEKGNMSAYSTEQTGLGSGLITKQEKNQDKVLSEIKKIASDRLAEYNKKN